MWHSTDKGTLCPFTFVQFMNYRWRRDGAEKQKQQSQRGPMLYITQLACGNCAMRCSCLGWCKQSLSASGGSAMCLDAAVMGTCPTFINQSWKKGETVWWEERMRRRRGEGVCWESRGARERDFLSGGGAGWGGGFEQGLYWCSKHSCGRQLTSWPGSSPKLCLLSLSAYTVTFLSSLESTPPPPT